MGAANHLHATTPPYIELLVLKDGQAYNTILSPPPGLAMAVIHGRKCKTKRTLLSECARALEFPPYMEKTWEAFLACVTDLQWLPAAGYLLIITHAEHILDEDEDEYKPFLSLLDAAGKMWATEQPLRPEMPFHVIFTVAERLKATRKRWGIPRFKP